MITVDETKLREMGDDELDPIDLETVNTFIQYILDNGVIALPGIITAVAYFHNDDDPGWIFAVRPRVGWNELPDDKYPHAQVAGFFVEARDIEPRDDKGRLPVDGGECTSYEAALQIAQNIVRELEPLVPAYEKLWGNK